MIIDNDKYPRNRTLEFTLAYQLILWANPTAPSGCKFFNILLCLCNNIYIWDFLGTNSVTEIFPSMFGV